jgi:hypothetical protein
MSLLAGVLPLVDVLPLALLKPCVLEPLPELPNPELPDPLPAVEPPDCPSVESPDENSLRSMLVYLAKVATPECADDVP